MKILEVRNLTVYFYTYAGVVRAVENVSFDLYKGETLAIVGETGSGKSVTTRAITRLVSPPGKIVSGSVIYRRDGEELDLLKLPDEELRKIRGSEIAYVFQDPSSALDPLYTVGYQISETVAAHRGGKIKQYLGEAVELLRRVLIPDPESRSKAYPHQLSGGMKQRSVIAMAISNRPKILIADEPTTAVDVTVQAQLLHLFKKLKEEIGMSIIFITHNMGLVAEHADRVIVMYGGKIVEEGPVDEVFENPRHPYTQGLLRAVINPIKTQERLEPVPGTIPNLINPPAGCRFHPRCPYFIKGKCDVEEPPLVGDRHKVACWLYV
ncbi:MULTISPECIES: ABC transporter ATP-binding protein [Pyrobaculum]|uniref:Nickel import system ATP-binding protein NikD n=2 Tax=Pyrobaculum arsenaticum TaxID=121277 RepID=A4WJH5_PYRAR|nr:ABC transporter ATP-binding protein [Pyrobaculum arsenaticum]ABP50542.1 oligopeptide/dipeptide ABC transporter, ATPase subunit [Pyrobaculum arsenaticum DSM 13514]MCY0890529.1 ABC transporter ATP-binding protein [Pyrobaculum arsenaticum]NYR14529.1 ABC transporter ATP-binding protein [Pyrobaculum arsenaticum]